MILFKTFHSRRHHSQNLLASCSKSISSCSPHLSNLSCSKSRPACSPGPLQFSCSNSTGHHHLHSQSGTKERLTALGEEQSGPQPNDKLQVPLDAPAVVSPGAFYTSACGSTETSGACRPPRSNPGISGLERPPVLGEEGLAQSSSAVLSAHH